MTKPFESDKSGISDPYALRTWLLSDGTLHADRIEVVMTRTDQNNNLDESAPRQFSESWRVCVNHDDGQGTPQSTAFVFHYDCYNYNEWTSLKSITNAYGTLKFDSDAVDMACPLERGFERDHHLCTDGAVLLPIAAAIYQQALHLVGWDREVSKGPNEVRAQFDNIHFQVIDPEQIGYADPATFLVEALQKDTCGLSGVAHLMRSCMEDNPATPEKGKIAALKERFEDLSEFGPPAGMTYIDAVKALAEAGLPLGLYPFSRTETTYYETGEDYNYTVKGTTSLLYEACCADNIDAIRALAQCGVDPLTVTECEEKGVKTRKTPWMTAIESGSIEAVEILWNNASPSVQQTMLESYEERFVRISTKAKKQLLEQYEESEDKHPFFAAIKARRAIDQVLQPASPAPI